MLQNAYKTTAMGEGNNTLTPFHISAMQITPQDILKCHLTVTNKNNKSVNIEIGGQEKVQFPVMLCITTNGRNMSMSTCQFLQSCDQRS
jgi:hypothetical protein